MATVAASGDGNAPSTATNKVNDGATIFHGGNADTSAGVVTKVVTIKEAADDVGSVIGSKIALNDGTGASTTDRVGLKKAVDAGQLSYNPSGTDWVMRGGNVVTTLAGTAYTGFATPGANYDGGVRDSVHEVSGTRALGTSGTINFYAQPSTEITPGYTKGLGAGSITRFVAPSGTGSVASLDREATTSRSVPGGLVFQYGSTVPSGTNYKAKNLFES
jgi:hypothetical protein